MRFLIILLFIIPIFSNGQPKKIEIPLEINGEESYTYKYFKKVLTDIPIDSLENSENPFYFRYITPRHIAEVWKDNNEKLQGKFISFAEKKTDSTDLKYLNDERKKDYFVQVNSMKKKYANRIYNKLSMWKIDTINSSIMPVGVNEEIHGVLMEFSNEKNYKFKEFWISNNPKKQSVSDKKIAELSKLILLIMDNEKLYKKLIDNLPKGCFNMANGFIKCNN